MAWSRQKGLAAAAVVTPAAFAACSLLVDTNGLSGGPRGVTEGGTTDVAPNGGDGAAGDAADAADGTDGNASPPSCTNGGGGVCAGESCCASPLVTGGQVFLQSNRPGALAQVSTFRLDRFKVTVGRFRAFVSSYALPAADAGAHPNIPGSGWNPGWNAELPQSSSALSLAVQCDPAATWTAAPGANESLVMNCLDWYVSFAFCAWDQGRLPTEAEWNYAAEGGDEQRYYPWSVPPDASTIGPTYADYSCTAAGLGCLLPPGSFSPLGDGKWGQADLAGSVLEWQLDWGDPNPYPASCVDCANVVDSVDGGARSDRAAGYTFSAVYQITSRRNSDPPASALKIRGARCARSP